MPDAILVNGNEFSWSSIEFKINGERFFGFTNISYKDTRDRAHVYGQSKSQAPRGRTSGKYTMDNVTVTAFKNSAMAFIKALADANDGIRYGDTPFEIVVQYIEGDLAPVTDEIQDCRMISFADNPSEGNEALTVDMEIQPMRLVRNGLTLYNSIED